MEEDEAKRQGRYPAIERMTGSASQIAAEPEAEEADCLTGSLAIVPVRMALAILSKPQRYKGIIIPCVSQTQVRALLIEGDEDVGAQQPDQIDAHRRSSGDRLRGASSGAHCAYV
jgi:hypothetical protein